MWLDEENPQDPYKTAGTSDTNGTPSVGVGGGTAQPGGTSANASTTTPTPNNQPTQNFATVQDYLGANKQQGEALGQEFTGALDTNLTNEKSAIDTAAKQADSDITSGTTEYNPGLVSQAVSNPTAVANNPDQLQSFLKQWNASYSGPTSFESSSDYAPAQAASSEAQTKGAEASTTGGQQQLLQDNFGVYGQGNKGLDQNILQNSSAYPTVQNQAAEFGTIPTYLQNAATPLDAQATQAATDTAAAQANTRVAFANEPATFQAGINNEVTQAQNAATTQANQYQADLASGDSAKIIADIQAANPGADASTIQQYLTSLQKDYGSTPDLSSQYSFNPVTAITAANTATAQDYANAAAYGQLTGTDYSGILNPNNVSQAGTAPQANSALNPTNIQNYLKTQLDTQDQGLLKTDANLAAGIDKGTTDVNTAAATAQKYIDAATRQGTSFANSPMLQKMLTDAQNSQSYWLKQGQAANSPQVAAYQAIINSISKYANLSTAPTSAVNPGSPSIPGTGSTPNSVFVPNPANTHTPTANPGTYVDPTKLTQPAPINGLTVDQLTKKMQDSINAITPGRTATDQKTSMTNDTNAMKDLYTKYLSGQATAAQYVQLQQLLKKYNLG